MTIREYFDEALRRLRDVGWPADEARGAARILTDEIVGVRYAHLSRPEAEVEENAAALWREKLAQVERGVPLDHVLGRREFFGLELLSDARALVPRPETELLVEATIARLKTHPAPRIADLGTGSGAIAIAVAHSLPNAQVWASDASPNALQLAQSNAEKHGVAQRITFLPGVLGDWAAPLNSQTFDAILTNPPYIASAEIETLQIQVRNHDPRPALDGGPDGLVCYRQLAEQCRKLLAPEGFLLAELGAGQFAAVREIFAGQGWRVWEPFLDFQGIERVIEAGGLD